jgi:hypothetical protein
MKSLSPHLPRVVGALNEVVPRLHFYAYTTANPQAECETITIFGVDRDGTLRDGYELGDDHAKRDIFEDTLKVVRFFFAGTHSW